MIELSPPVRRFLAVALLLALTMLVGFALASLGGRVGRATEDLADVRFRRARLEALAVEKPAAAARTSGPADVMPRLMSGETAGAALAGLQENVRAILTAEGMTVELMQARPFVQQGPLTLVAVDVVAKGSERGVLQILRQLETGAMPLNVQRLRITAGPSAEGEHSLEAQISVYWGQPPRGLP